MQKLPRTFLGGPGNDTLYGGPGPDDYFHGTCAPAVHASTRMHMAYACTEMLGMSARQVETPMISFSAGRVMTPISTV